MTESTEFRIPSPVLGPPVPTVREREREMRRKFDFTKILNKVHEIKTGLQVTSYTISVYENSLPWGPNPFWDAFSYEPLVAAVYLQDNADFEDLVVRAGLAHLGGGEELRLQPLEITFGLHALQQDGAHHAAPANESDSLDRHSPQSVTDVGAKIISPESCRPAGNRPDFPFWKASLR